MYVYIEASIWASDYLTIREMQQSNADEKKKDQKAHCNRVLVAFKTM